MRWSVSITRRTVTRILVVGAFTGGVVGSRGGPKSSENEELREKWGRDEAIRYMLQHGGVKHRETVEWSMGFCAVVGITTDSFPTITTLVHDPARSTHSRGVPLHYRTILPFKLIGGERARGYNEFPNFSYRWRRWRNYSSDIVRYIAQVSSHQTAQGRQIRPIGNKIIVECL